MSSFARPTDLVRASATTELARFRRIVHLSQRLRATVASARRSRARRAAERARVRAAPLWSLEPEEIHDVMRAWR